MVLKELVEEKPRVILTMDKGMVIVVLASKTIKTRPRTY